MKGKRWMGALLIGAVLLSGCSLSQVKERVVSTFQKQVDVEAELVKLFGPIDQRLVLGEGLVLLSPEQEGARNLAYVVGQGEEVQLAGEKVQIAASGTVTLSEENGWAVVQTLKDEAPQYAAYEVSAAGLKPVDYYAAKAPEPSVKEGHHLVVNTQLNVLWHYENGTLVETYRVATGRQHGPQPTATDWAKNFTTPTGDFRLINFVTNPPYTSAVDGHFVEGGDPANPLGTRWMGFSAIPGVDDAGGLYAIHGTSEPDKIGTWASEGCIRMHTAEAEALFAILEDVSPTVRVVAD